jgi:hypothetical protein
MTKPQILELLRALAEAIRELGSVPSGELYARVMNHLTLEQYQAIIDTLKRAGLVCEENNLLLWNNTIQKG